MSSSTAKNGMIFTTTLVMLFRFRRRGQLTSAPGFQVFNLFGDSMGAFFFRVDRPGGSGGVYEKVYSNMDWRIIAHNTSVGTYQ